MIVLNKDANADRLSPDKFEDAVRRNQTPQGFSDFSFHSVQWSATKGSAFGIRKPLKRLDRNFIFAFS